MKSKEMTTELERLIEVSSLPMCAIETQFAVDATVFNTSRFFTGDSAKRGTDTQEGSNVKLNAMVGVRTHIITSFRVLEGTDHESRTLPDLVYQTRKNFTIEEVSADKGYIGTQNIVAIHGVGANPFIPFKINSKGEGSYYDTVDDAALVSKLFHFFSMNRESFLKSYHQRSNIESAFSMLKAKFGNSIRSKTKTARTNEVLCKVLCHNIYVLCMEIRKRNITLDFTETKFNS